MYSVAGCMILLKRPLPSGNVGRWSVSNEYSMCDLNLGKWSVSNEYSMCDLNLGRWSVSNDYSMCDLRVFQRNTAHTPFSHSLVSAKVLWIWHTFYVYVYDLHDILFQRFRCEALLPPAGAFDGRQVQMGMWTSLWRHSPVHSKVHSLSPSIL